jgi:hypothetical protein
LCIVLSAGSLVWPPIEPALLSLLVSMFIVPSQ